MTLSTIKTNIDIMCNDQRFHIGRERECPKLLRFDSPVNQQPLGYQHCFYYGRAVILSFKVPSFPELMMPLKDM